MIARLQTVVIDVILSLNFDAILHKIYFLFRLLQLNEQTMACRIGNVLLTFQFPSPQSAIKFPKICTRQLDLFSRIVFCQDGWGGGRGGEGEG